MLAVNNLVVNVFVDEGVRTPGTDATDAHVLLGVTTVGARSRSEAVRRRLSVPSSGISAHRLAAVRQQQPGADSMMSARRERTASAAMDSSRCLSQGAMLAWRASSVAAERWAV